MLSHASLVDALRYDPETGLFYWRKKVSAKVVVGRIVGSKHSQGYTQLKLYGAVYLAHRLAWFYMTGAWPRDEIDHINGDRSDNRLSNLRECSPAENRQNKVALLREGRLPGAYWHKGDQKWMARIKVNRLSRYIGSYDSQEEAHLAYVKKKRELHSFSPELRYA